MLDLRQTSEYASFMLRIGWIVEKKDKVNYLIKKFPLIGSFMKIQRPEKIDFTCISELVHEYRTFQVIIEPKDTNQESKIKIHGYKQSKSPFLPSKTILLDLRKSEKQLLEEMHYKTRYNIKKASQNPNFKIQISNDIESFANFWQECALKQRGMFLSQKKEIVGLYKAFGKKAHILVVTSHTSKLNTGGNHTRGGVAPAADLGGELLAGILMVRTKDIAYYMYAASSEAGKKLFAPTLVAWKAIMLAKKLGCKIFDFEGIYDERFPLKSWLGFSRFKKSFGGSEIEYPGAFVKKRLPL